MMTRARTAALYVCGAATDVDGALAWPDPGMLDVRNIRNIATSPGARK